MDNTVTKQELIRKMDNLCGYRTEELLITLKSLDEIMSHRRELAKAYSVGNEELKEYILKDIEYLDDQLKLMFSI